ncbi:hypothetical protein B296_00024551 [Ensete ventricosum]|uniref:Uncharacterized protein n=1 Tax=Ensete ventricosum TaxID=4639 RepID=A0A426XVN8_ENSVE|nr:hypothetical protein B296_00024551 [Ensete ventricosum]
MTDDEIRKAKRFERGLRPTIRSQISILKLSLYTDVVEKVREGMNIKIVIRGLRCLD